ncbi:MAG: hypothetical protein AB1Z51_11330 [Desulfuromonadales bacterium]
MNRICPVYCPGALCRIETGVNLVSMAGMAAVTTSAHHRLFGVAPVYPAADMDPGRPDNSVRHDDAD